MNKVISFISGKEYSLADLFGGDTKIIIPDLQRDYCWGNYAVTDRKSSKTKELVSDFIKNIVELFEEKSDSSLTMGLIYGYEQPHNHIQICDGQQRLTTLFLILGYINIKCSGVYDDYIISKQEREDDYEPHLQYAIRESTLYFLSDLSRKVFIERNTKVTDIKLSNWYFAEYDNDASIQSMIAALQIIDNVFNSLEFNCFLELGKFVLNNLRVLYYDMENRSRGEETYVIINTTGEPLSPTENIKPILLGNSKLTKEQVQLYSDQWEDREEWFWNHRGTDTTSDNGMQVFFMWYWQIGLMQERAWVNEKPVPLNPRNLFISAPTKMKESTKEVKLSMENYEKFRSLDNIEKYSYLRSVKAITDSDVCVLMLDASTGIQAQDKHILGLALELSKAIVICVNKIDLLDQEELKKWNKLIEYEFQFVPYAKVVYLSALKKKRVHLLMPQVIEAYQNYNKQIKTSLLNKVIEDATAIHEAPSYKGRRLKIYFVSQVDICPPKFEFSVNDKSLIHFSYERYLENQIRKNFDLTGTPIILKFKNHREE